MRLIAGLVLGLFLGIIFPAEVGAIVGSATASVSELFATDQNAALEAMLRDEYARLAKIRKEFGVFKAIEVCQADNDQFNRFARTKGLPSSGLVCR